MPSDSTVPPSQPPHSRLRGLSSELIPEIRKYGEAHGQRVVDSIEQGGLTSGHKSGLLRAKSLDGLLSSLYLTSVAVLGERRDSALAAVGSYGRKTLALHSDVDVRLISERSVASAEPLAEALLYPLWDAGIDVGHQVISVSDTLELALTDLPTATTLLDTRHVVGQPDVTRALTVGAFKGPFGPGHLRNFLESLEATSQARRERFGDSVFLLEPDVKNGAGGLRDLDVARWAIQARYRVNDFEGMARAGVLTKREWRDLELAYRFLTVVRAWLHLFSGRRSDRLVFDAQEKVALKLGYGQGASGVESFMSEYYRHARVVARAGRMAIVRALPPPSIAPTQVVLGQGLALRGKKVGFSSADQLLGEPARALCLYSVAVEQGVGVEESSRQEVARACTSEIFCRSLRASRKAIDIFVRLVKLVQDTQFVGGSILRELHDVGLLLALIPEFSPVVGRVHHDIYHVYTVDVHSVAAVDRLRGICRGEGATEQPLACLLGAEISRPRVLFFAALLHDIGKDQGGRDHGNRGADMAPEILRRFGFEAREIEAVQHLIRKHLRMYHVATRRDIDDPRTLEAFCAEVAGAQGLKELYLLTIADVSTTSPTAMTAWKSRMLAELYVAAKRWFAEGGNARGADYPAEVRRQIHELLEPTQAPELSSGLVSSMLDGLPERYLYANAPEAVIKQLKFVSEAEGKNAYIRVIDESEPYVELCIVADDVPGLLSAIAAALAAANIKVVGAQIYSWQPAKGKRRALDLFWIRGGREVATALRSVPQVEKTLSQILSKDKDARELVLSQTANVRWTERAAPSVPTEITIDNRSGSRHTLVEIITQDRRDLLFWLSTAIHEAGATIDLAKINTEGECVADVFYVSNEDKEKLSPEQIRAVRQRVVAVLSKIEGELES